MSLALEQNKRIAEALGLRYIIDLDAFVMDPDPFIPNNAVSGPFDSKPGFWVIIKHGPKMDWWHKFMVHICADYRQHPLSHKVIYYIPFDFIGPQLAVELDKFLEGR